MLPEFGRCGELFQTPSGTAFADIPVNEHGETRPIRSKRFRSWLRRCHYEAPSVGCRLRNRRLAGRHFVRVYGSQPHSCHREHYRSRSASRCVRTII